MQTNIHLWSYLAHFSLEWEIFQTKVAEDIKAHILLSVTLFQQSCPVWENVENIVELDRPQMTLWRTRIACWIPESTNVQSEYVILTAFPLQQWLHERIRTLPVLLTPKITFFRNIMLDSFRRFGGSSSVSKAYDSTKRCYLRTKAQNIDSRKCSVIDTHRHETSNYYINFETGCSEVLTLYRTTVIHTDVT